jgi:16S rRNA (cytosine967-C5)-methyltransferase
VEEGGAFASPLLERAADELADPRDVGLLHEITLGVLRRRASLDHVLAQAAGRPPESLDPAVRAILRLGAYELLHLTRVPDFAAVDGAVRLTHAGGASRASGLVNAVLRRIARERVSLLPPAAAEGDVAALALETSHPAWWTERLVARLGWARARAVLEADNRPAPLVLRSARRRMEPAAVADRLRSEGVSTEPGAFLHEALRVLSGLPQHTAAWKEGLAWVQDEAAQLPVALLGSMLPGPALDACAAPGGKTLQMADVLEAGAVLVAADRHLGRLRRLTSGLARVGPAGVLPLAADAARPALRAGFAVALVDAPCSGTGTLRRHPELRWRLRPEDPARLAHLQAGVLSSTAALVRPGGRLVYAVCSMEPEEGEEMVAAFLQREPGLGSRTDGTFSPRPHTAPAMRADACAPRRT